MSDDRPQADINDSYGDPDEKTIADAVRAMNAGVEPDGEPIEEEDSGVQMSLALEALGESSVRVLTIPFGLVENRVSVLITLDYTPNEDGTGPAAVDIGIVTAGGPNPSEETPQELASLLGGIVEAMNEEEFTLAWAANMERQAYEEAARADAENEGDHL